MANILLIEWVQMLAATVGVAMTAFSIVVMSRRLFQMQMDGINGLAGLAVRVGRRRETMRLIKHAVILLSGIYVVDFRIQNGFLPSIPFVYVTRNLTLTFLSVLMMTETVWEHFDRWVITRMVDAEKDRRQHRRSTDVAPEP